MSLVSRLRARLATGALVLALAPALAPRPLAAQRRDSALYQQLSWRLIGPFRGGRTVGAAGVPSEPNVFYAGVNNGGVWKTTDFGLTWTPIFDAQSTGSVGTLAVAPSDPSVVYVGSGEGLQRPDLSVGDGIYRSGDGGKTWEHMGLRDGRQIGAILVDPRDANRIFVAVLGHPYGPNPERGVFRSTDGGRTFEKVLYRDENTGAIDLALDPTNPQTIYAVLWAARQGPWEYDNAYSGPGSGLYKSVDGGTTWTPIGRGLPTPAQGLGRIGIAIAPDDPARMYALVEAPPQYGGLYRSDDAGASWTRVNAEQRVWGRGADFANVRVDPRDRDVLYVANTSTYKSTDGGATFTAWKGAPGGDDYHTIWINPTNPDIILLAADQGATLTVNGGRTWSSWYNQPTGQFFHVITDGRFPYRVCGAQQESGSACTLSRSDYGEITFRDWHPVGVEEYGYVAPDPLHPGIIYGGKVTRYDERTSQTQEVGPDVLRTGTYRFDRTAPLIFSKADPHALYFAAQVLFRTTDGGQHWRVISPDLTRANPGVPPTLGIYAGEAASHPHRGVIYSIAPSPRRANLLWVGTDDGLVHVTRDLGAHWTNVSPPALGPWDKVTQIDAGHFDTATAYVSVSRFRLDDLRPYVYRTHDGGRTWTAITTGLSDDAPVNVVREDPVRRGLLYAGTEHAVYVSFDDGDHWQSLRLDMPATSIRDLVVHDNDLVIATHGRSFWILDDIAPLRELDARTASLDAHLFRPAPAYRVRRSTNTDTPLPPEIPAGRNPPDGAIIDYWLRAAPQAPVTLEIRDAAGRLVRRWSSADSAPSLDPRDHNVPMYWARAPRGLSAAPGMHRFVWNLRYPAPAVGRRDFPISAIPHDTPLEPLGVLVLPGRYTVRLTVDGRTETAPLEVRMDPRVTTPASGLARQFALARRVAAAIDRARQARGRTSGAAADSIAALDARLATLYDVIEGADAAPTTQTAAAAEATLAALDAELRRAKLPPLASSPAGR